MHHDAQWKNQQAGNATQAQKHAGAAIVHDEKAQTLRTEKYHADNLGRAAESIGKKAELSHFGKGTDKDPRSHDELHADAATAHDKASTAYESAGDDRQASYHAEEANKHQTCSFGTDSESAAAE